MELNLGEMLVRSTCAFFAILLLARIIGKKQLSQLTFTQLGMISFVLNIFASLLQPAVGFMTDKKPFPYALPLGMVSSFIGLSLLILSGEYWMILMSVIFLGIGSAKIRSKESSIHSR